MPSHLPSSQTDYILGYGFNDDSGDIAEDEFGRNETVFIIPEKLTHHSPGVECVCCGGRQPTGTAHLTMPAWAAFNAVIRHLERDDVLDANFEETSKCFEKTLMGLCIYDGQLLTLEQYHRIRDLGVQELKLIEYEAISGAHKTTISLRFFNHHWKIL